MIKLFHTKTFKNILFDPDTTDIFLIIIIYNEMFTVQLIQIVDIVHFYYAMCAFMTVMKVCHIF